MVPVEDDVEEDDSGLHTNSGDGSLDDGRVDDGLVDDVLANDDGVEDTQVNDGRSDDGLVVRHLGQQLKVRTGGRTQLMVQLLYEQNSSSQ